MRIIFLRASPPQEPYRQSPFFSKSKVHTNNHSKVHGDWRFLGTVKEMVLLVLLDTSIVAIYAWLPDDVSLLKDKITTFTLKTNDIITV